MFSLGKKTDVFLRFICIAYVTQGIAQHFCLIAQPLDNYMLKELGKNAVQVAYVASILMIPWMVKPIYGMLSDLVPICGYRRKSYLGLAYGLGGMLYLIAAACNSFYWLIAALFMTAIGMAVGTTIICGLSLEVGRPTQSTRRFQSIQAVCYYSANIVSFLVGGILCSDFLPANALKLAAVIAALPCFITAVAAYFWLREEKVVSVPGQGMVILKQAFASKGLWAVAVFMCCWSFSPGFGTPLYFHETKVLNFSQLFIGQLGAMNSLGVIVGALVFKAVIDQKVSPRKQALIAVITGTISTLAYLALSSTSSAITLEFFRGIANILAILTVYGLAADVSPKGLESTTIATLVAAYNIAEQISNVLGAHLYTHVFGEHGRGFNRLIVVSALATLACLLLIPLLPKRDQYLLTNVSEI